MGSDQQDFEVYKIERVVPIAVKRDISAKVLVTLPQSVTTICTFGRIS